jgi:hypothetical protein
VGPNKSTGLVAEPYHIVPEVTKDEKKSADMLLDKTDSMSAIRSNVNRFLGGRTFRWNPEETPPQIPEAMW